MNIRWLKQAFGGDRIWHFDIKATDNSTIFANLGKGGKLWIDYWDKLREKDDVLIDWAGNWTSVYKMVVQITESTPQVQMGFFCKKK